MLADRQPPPLPSGFHFVVIQGISLDELEAMGLASFTIIERVSVTDKRLWDYRKITAINQRDWKKLYLLLQEYQVTVVCTDSPQYLDLCLADAQAKQDGQQG